MLREDIKDIGHLNLCKVLEKPYDVCFYFISKLYNDVFKTVKKSRIYIFRNTALKFKIT